MKKIFLSIFAALLICFFMTTSIFGEESTDAVVTETDTAEEVVTESVVATEALTETDTEATALQVSDTETQTWSGALASFVKENFTETSLSAFALALLSFCVEHFMSNKNLKKNMGVLNGNAIEIATSSAESIKNNTTALEKLMGQVTLTLNAISKTAQERDALEAALKESRELMNSVVVACSESSELVANLLLMSKIPNSKKEEMYAKYLESVKGLKAIQMPAMLHESEEVSANDTE